MTACANAAVVALAGVVWTGTKGGAVLGVIFKGT